MADIKEITRDIVVALIQSGAIVIPAAIPSIEKSEVSIKKVQQAYKDIYQTVSNAELGKFE